jgi:NAD(P)-dependent dehydrogenase (short-subunit alcohol dehydrogenase family)
MDIIDALLFLADPKHSFINGETIVVDGGMSKMMVYHNDHGWTYQPK